MSGYLMHVSATVQCPHGGTVSGMAASTRVSVGGQPALTASDSFMIAGCPLNVSGSPHPCVSVKWPVPATRVTIGGQPAVLTTSTGICQAGDQVPQGQPMVVTTQTRVGGV